MARFDFAASLADGSRFLKIENHPDMKILSRSILGFPLLCVALLAGVMNAPFPLLAQSVGYFQQTGSSATLRTFVNKMRDVVDTRDFGTVGNGTTDDTAALQAAANAACGTVGTGGAAKTLYISSGFYKITTTITISCGLRVIGDGWAGDSSAAIQNQFITGNAGLSGSIIEPTSTVAGLTFVTNQAVTVRDIGVVYLSRPSALSGIAGITIQAAASATSPATLAWNVGSAVDHVWLYGADRNLLLVNAGSFTVSNNLLQMHATSGIRIQGPNLPYAGDWEIGPGNTFWSGSITTCQHVIITSGGGGRINDNKFNTCGSVNVISPLTTTGVQWSPDLNVANNSLEPIVVTGNTMEGLSRCLWFYGGNVGQNATATQIVVTGNQMWCLEDILTTATSTNAQWISGMTIAGNFMNSQTQAGISTTTSNLDLDGVNNVNISGNLFGLVQGAGGDTSTAINIGAHSATISQLANKAMANVTIPNTVPLSLNAAAGTLLGGGSPAAFSAAPVLGVAGTTVGSLGFQNATSGTETIQPATGALASGIATLPAGTYNFVGDSLTQTLTNKTIACANNTCTVRIANDVSGLGTGIATALGVNVGTAGAPVINGGALGTPSSGVATNLTGTASGLTAGGVVANGVTRAMEAQGVARSVIGVTGNATANVADIQGTANQVLSVNSAGTALAFGTVNLASASAVAGTLPIANGGTNDTGTAWASYTPTISCSGGTTTGSVPTGFFKTIGKTTFVRLILTTTTTTCTGATLGLPNTSLGGVVLTGRESAVNGAMFVCGTPSSAATCSVWGTTGSGSAALNSATYTFLGVYDSN